MDANPRRSHRARPLRSLFAAAVVLVAVLAAALTAAADGPTKVHQLPIVDRAIALHGGDLYRASTTTLDVCSKSGCYHVVARQDGDLYEHVVSGQVGEHQRKVRATNDTVEVWQDGAPVAVAEGEAVVLTGHLIGCQDDESNAVSAHFEACARRAAAGNVTLVGTPAVRVLEDDTNTNVTVNADTTAQTLDVRVVGIAAENWRWEASYSYTKV